MENIIGGRNYERQTNDNTLQDAAKTLQNITNSLKKVVKVVRFLYSIIPGGPFTLGFMIAGLVFMIIAFIIIAGFIGVIPGGSIPRIPNSSGAIETIPGLTLTLTGPAPVDNGANLEFTIDINYNQSSPPLSSLIVYAQIPPVAEFVEASGAFEFKDGEISWPMSQNITRLTFTLRATSVDTEYKDYRVYARVAAGSGSGAGSSPSNDSCGGKYDLASTPIGANFGDPDCDFTKDNLYALLKQLDSNNADLWYFKIVPCESGYNPNAYNGAAVDAAGAYGLYQMGKGKNGQYDHGDVGWATQTSNAITYNRDLIGGSFAYWGCR